ncbi:unnamed protein product [Euphydryas editha]|uniref:DNA 3'-5' helicase n=1 Tax=Euphydryas editha TaxID=104508 RepID=A0AAU9UB87_EUPED|nr:unnamed protein product [Euphydryas editha]
MTFKFDVVARYQALVGGSEPLQSYLHKRLAENLNSEAALGTVGDVAQCVQWLNSTFLSVRAARDPKRYLGLPHAATAQLISKKIEELCVKAMNGLASAGLITMDEASCIETTEAGRLMSVYYLDLETMKLIMKLEGSESLERLLWFVCESHELSDMHLRVDERRCLNALNRNNAAATIRYPMKGKINSRQMKLNCIIQAVLGCLPIPDPSLNQEAMKIMRIADRVCKCLVSYITRPNFVSQRPKFFTTILNSLILAKCISKSLWENSPYVSRQLKGIGPTFSALLASAGKVNFMLLEESHPRDLERIMNKGPPAGNILRKQISLLPKYNLTATPIDERTVEIKLSLLNHAFLAENVDNLTAGINHKSNIIVGDSENTLLYFTNFTDSNLMNVYDGCITFKLTRSDNNEQKILIHCISSSFVGIDAQCQYLFQDINISSNKIENPKHISLTTPINPTQETFSNIGKIRKRKTQNDSEITQSKEKKKRETELITKFNVLKESFEKASKEIKVNLNETREMSNKILENLIEPEQNHNKSFEKLEHPNLMLTNDSFQNAFEVEFEYDDFEDDKQVNDILDDIEKEIKIGEYKVVASTSYQMSPRSQSKLNYNIPKIKCLNAKRSILNKQNNYNFLDKLERNLNNESDTDDIENDNGFNNAVKIKLEKYLKINSNNNAKTNAINLVESIISGQGEKFREPYSTDAISISDAGEKQNKCKNNNTSDLLKQNAESDIFNKDKISLENQTSRYKTDTINGKISNDEITNNLNVLVSENSVTDNDEENESKEIVNVESNEIINNIHNTAPYGSSIHNKNLIKNLPKLSTIESTTKTISVADSNELENFNNTLTLSNINSSASLIPLPENKCLVAYNSCNSLKNNLNNRGLIKKNTLEYMKNHSLNKTNYFNTTIQNSYKQKVHLIGKLEINLNLTEIVSSNSDNPEFNTKQQSTEIVEDSKCTSYNNIDKNKLKLNANKNNMDICSTTDISYDESLRSDIIRRTNELCEDSVDKEIKLSKSNPAVSDILQKYNRIVKGGNKNHVKTEQLTSNEEKNIETYSAEIDMKPKRKYKIRDLENIQVDLPDSLITRHEPATFINRDIIGGNMFIRNNTEVNDVDLGNISSIKDEIDHLENNVSTEFMLEELTDSNLNLDVSEAILNPKMLLQSVSEVNNEEVIIPPPIEFRDYDDVSSNASFSVHEDNINIDYNILKSQDYINESEQRKDVCLESSEDDLSPSKEVDETWTTLSNINNLKPRLTKHKSVTSELQCLDDVTS